MGEQDADDALARSALARIARGDEGALEELHSLYASAVFAFVSARLGDRGAAEEAAVDVWLGCWRSALDALPAALAETVRLAWLHELPYAEIAQVTDVPVGTVKSRVSRARALMQETLGGRL